MRSHENAIPRPSGFDGYVCDPSIKIRILDHIKAAQKKGCMPPHMLFSGPPGTGKTTIAGIIARTMNVPMLKFVGMELTKKDQLRELFKVPEYGGILFIDEIHSVSKEVSELLYPVMEDGILPAKGNPQLLLHLNPITVIGATTEPGSLEKPIVDRFIVKIRIPDYTTEQMRVIIKNMAAKLSGAQFEENALNVIADRSKYIPRVAGGLLTQVLDSAIANDMPIVTSQFVETVMQTLGVDSHGMDSTDRAILKALCTNTKGIGLETLAQIVSEDPNWLASGYEPYLMRRGYMIRTRTGRVITAEGRQFLREATKAGTMWG